MGIKTLLLLLLSKDNVSLNLAKKNGSFGMQFEDQKFAKRIRIKKNDQKD